MTHVEVAGKRSPNRRHWPRVKLALPVVVTQRMEEGGGAVCSHTAQSVDLSPGGFYLTSREGKVFAPEELLSVSVGIPWEARHRFPFSRLTGPCRVVRVDQVTTESGTTQGVALAFCGTDAVTILGTARIPR